MPPSSRNQRATKKLQRTPYDRHESGNHRPFFSALKATVASVLRPFSNSWSSNAEKETPNHKRASRSLLDPELSPHYLGRTPHIVRINNRSHIRTLDGIEGKSNEDDLSSKQFSQDFVENKTASRRGSMQSGLPPEKYQQLSSEPHLQTPPLTSSSAALLDILRSIRTNPNAGSLPHITPVSQLSTSQSSKKNVPSQRIGRRSSTKRDLPQRPISETRKTDTGRTDGQIAPSYSSDEHFQSDQKSQHPKSTSSIELHPKKIRREEPGLKSVTSASKEARKEKLRQELIPIVYETLERIDLKKQKLVNAEVQTEEQPGNSSSVNKQDFVSEYEYSFPPAAGGNKKRVRAAFSALDEDLDELFDKDEDTAMTDAASRSMTKHHEPLISGPDKKAPKTLLPRSGPTFEQLQSSLSPKRNRSGTEESAIVPSSYPKTQEKEDIPAKTAESTIDTTFTPAESQTTSTSKSFAAIPEKKDTEKLPESLSDNIPKFEFKSTTSAPKSIAETEGTENQNKTPIFSFGKSSDKANETSNQTTFTTEKPAATQKPFTFGQPSEKDLSVEKTEAPKPAFNFKPASPNKDEQAPALSFNFGKKLEEKEPENSSKPSFTFGLPSQQQPSKPITPSFTFGQPTDRKISEIPTKPSFNFGQLAPIKKSEEQKVEVADSTPSDKNNLNVPKLNFNFGRSSENKESTALKPAFSFDQAATTATSQSPQPTFTFGKPSTGQKSANIATEPSTNIVPSANTETPKFTFGQNAEREVTEASKTTEDKKEEVSKPTFSFGQTLKGDEQIAPAKPSFSFGQSFAKNENKESTIPAADNNAAKPTFTFGQPTSLGTSTATKPTFSFGTSQSKDEVAKNEKPTTSMFSFSKPSDVNVKDNTDRQNERPADVKPATPVFSFGSSGATNTFNKTEKPTAFSTGINASTSNTLTANDENKGPTGKIELNDQEKKNPLSFTSTDKPFSFSKPTESDTAQTTAPFTFGSNTNPPAPIFGSSPFNTATSGNMKAPSSEFSANGPTGAPGFGLSGTSSTQQPDTANASAPSGFGSGFSQPSSQPTGIFGSSTFASTNSPFSSKPNADPSGSTSTANTFSNTGQPPSAGFTFGASNNTNPSGFGASSPSGFTANLGNTTPAFSFGASQPSNPPNAGFSFSGASTPAFSAGSSTTQSPAPQTQSGIQFNLGSTNEQPNPPAGRKIAVPRSRRKR
ncbi:nucleoporin Nup124 [Schizosaccharomyces cryophilus OY26]|uniref:Nucleoporin Nup124 n=1 Tax=Schizosaccharomyces cryophilus (strain OY26 / ATCC MYA-4695 / CBS 11777 / NBRC 106824 / NRRL Y48691) TaxID=653667 RepID=S9XAR9_SCHCR|nr:nucleoporin Nup124 [Schizosaccharomyces cryophilus OY26]EPY50826.1 nucleoporin Nup124 [Schizosaccharomyces cryophilus OY26]